MKQTKLVSGWLVPDAVTASAGMCWGGAAPLGDFYRRQFTPVDSISKFFACNAVGEAEPVRCWLAGLDTWEAEFFDPLFSTRTNWLRKRYVHALHTVHALPDVRVAAGRLRDGVSDYFP